MWDTLMPVEPSRRAEYYERGWWRRETFPDDLWRAARGRPDAAGTGVTVGCCLTPAPGQPAGTP
jgi:hypothetical protein